MSPPGLGLPAGLCGQPTEGSVSVEGVYSKALLDTGSTVSTMSESHYNSYFSHIPLHPLASILEIECADGQSLPYLGYVITDIVAHGVDNMTPLPCVFLIVPDSRYNHSVPVLLGTNVLQTIIDRCRNERGPRFLQDANFHTSWYITFRTIVIRERQLQKQNYRLALVKSAELKSIVIQRAISTILH